jgi:putative membrane protein
MMNCCGGVAWPMMLGAWVGMTLWILLLAGLIWGLLRWLGGRPWHRPMTPPREPSAQDILEQRYARGEIDHSTFEQMRERLQASRPTRPPPYSPPGET